MELRHTIHLGKLHYISNDAFSRTLPLSIKKRAVILRMLQLLAVNVILKHVIVTMTTQEKM